MKDQLVTGIDGQATWIQVPDGFVNAWVHTPADGRAVGSVVLVPPHGREAVIAFRSLRVLAMTLARAGFVCVRLTMRGDGDSSPLLGDDVAAAWRSDVSAAVALAQELVPCVATSLVGLRLGAAVVDGVEDKNVGSRLLWEPVDGRPFLREQSILRKLSVPLEPMSKDEGVELVGTFFTSEQAASIRGLRSVVTEDPLYAVRREVDREAAARLYAVVTRDAEIPRPQLREIVDWLPTADARALQRWKPSADIYQSVDGAEVVQTHVRVGEHKLPGIVTRPVETTPTVGIVYSAAGAEPKDGPTGLWAISAAQAAAHGAATLRMDWRLLGDALDESQDREPNPYQDSSIDDAVEAVRYVHRQFAVPTIAVGLCVGGWIFARAAEKLGKTEPIDQIVALNNVAWQRRTKFYERVYEGPMIKKLLREEVNVGPAAVEDQAVGWRTKVKQSLKSGRDKGSKLIPTPIWRAMAGAGVVQEPVALLSRVPKSTRVHLIFGSEDTFRWELVRGPALLPQLTSMGHRIDVAVESALDHSLLAQVSRKWALRRINEIVDGYAGRG